MTQTYATHRRMDPWYHYVGFALWLVLAVETVRHALRHRPGAGWEAVLLAFLILSFLKIRTYALRVQDRVIRLEETLRLKALLPADLQAGIADLTPRQLVALRFAPDGELADRVREALAGNLDGEAIKKRIQGWRPDEFRV